MLFNYVMVFYVIFNHVSQNISVLRDQLSFIDNEDVQAMYDAVYTKYIMFKYAKNFSPSLLFIWSNTLMLAEILSNFGVCCRKFQGAMHIVALSEIAV